MGVGGHKGSVKLETIRSSAASYLGKYISKGSKVVKAMQDMGFDQFPKQWWSASMQIKKAFKDSIIRMDAMLCSSFFYQLEHYLHEKTIIWARFIEIQVGDSLRKMGLVGTLSQAAYKLIAGFD